MSARILVAEDYPANWMVAERMLEMRGHRADNARDGEQALAMLERGGYELVFMDCRMPVLDGYAAAHEIRRREAAGHGADVVIVAMSANASEADRRRCLAAGMDDYVAKPLTFEVLDETLARWLSPRPADRPALDEARLEQLALALSPAEMCGMLRKLAVEVAGEVEQIHAAGPGADRARLADAAHRIQNSAGLIGASGLAAAAAPLEARAQRGHSAPWRPDDAELLTLTHQWERTRAAIALRLG